MSCHASVAANRAARQQSRVGPRESAAGNRDWGVAAHRSIQQHVARRGHRIRHGAVRLENRVTSAGLARSSCADPLRGKVFMLNRMGRWSTGPRLAGAHGREQSRFAGGVDQPGAFDSDFNSRNGRRFQVCVELADDTIRMVVLQWRFRRTVIARVTWLRIRRAGRRAAGMRFTATTVVMRVVLVIRMGLRLRQIAAMRIAAIRVNVARGSAGGDYGEYRDQQPEHEPACGSGAATPRDTPPP